ncbi:MAG: DNA repair protein RadC [Planctomycetes bacterium]|nr:DNA repair protein RadC [Planctomycetota bacterium]
MGAETPVIARPGAAGHRSRLRDRFRRGGLTRDDELLELLLTFAIPRRDVKGLSRALLRTFGDLPTLFAAPERALRAIPGAGASCAAILRLVAVLRERLGACAVRSRPVLANAASVEEYLRAWIGARERECFVVLLLNSRNELIDARILFEGTVNETAVYPREVLRTALEANATAILLAHNHPGGTPCPSREDLDLTRRITGLAREFAIRVHDHLVVTRSACVSLREQDAGLFRT